MQRTTRRGFTLVELAVLVGLGGGVAAALSVTDPFSRSRESARQLKDATQIRGTHQSMVQWATQNNDRYPLPSLIDRAGSTTGETGAVLDTTANIISMLVFNGSMPTELAVSPVETNEAITPDEDFQFFDPESAATPDRALWDPAFDADFTDGAANMSYAHIQPAGARLEMWGDTFSASEVVYMNRGPQVTEATPAENGAVTPTVANAQSNTFRFYRSFETEERGHSWSANLAFNDNRVMFQMDLIARPNAESPFGPVTVSAEGYWLTLEDNSRRADVLTFDEPGHPRNAYLGIFVSAGEKPQDFKPIWD